MGIRPKYGAFFMTRQGTLGDLINLDHLTMDYFDYVFGAMNHSVMQGIFPPSVGDSCRMCSFVDKCPAMGQTGFIPLNTINRKENK
jgi:hypothetical protein